MSIKDYLDIMKFILDQYDCKLAPGICKEFISILFEVPLNHKKIKEYLLDVAADTDF